MGDKGHRKGSARSQSVDTGQNKDEREDKRKEEEAKELKGNWKGYKELVLECEGERCEVWQVIRVPKEWKGEEADRFYCGLCLGKEMRKLKEENAELRCQIQLKADNSIEENMNVKLTTYAEKLKENIKSSKEEVLKETKTIAMNNMEKELKEEVRREVKVSAAEERRKKRVIVFGMAENDDTEEVERLLQDLTNDCCRT